MCPVVRDRWSQKDDAGAALARVWFCLTVILSGWFAAPAGAVQAETETPSIVAAAAIAIEAESGRVLYAKEPDTPRAPASLTKLATALTAVELAPRDTVLTVLAQDLMGESSMGLCPGEQITLEAALYGLLLASGNDAAMTIARNLSGLPGDTSEAAVNRFVKQMNLLAQRLGLERTTFRNPHGLDQEGHVTTARDLALLTRAVLQRPELRRILQTPSYDDGVHAVQTTNRLLGRYPGLIGGKTGITEAAGYSLIEAAERHGTTVIVVVLGSTRDAWYADAVQLLDYAFAQLAPAPVAGLAGSAAEASERDILASRPIGDAAMTVGGPRALILEAPTPLPASNELWFWPASAVTTAVAAGVLASGFPAIMAVVIARRRTGRRATLDRGQRRGRRPGPRSVRPARVSTDRRRSAVLPARDEGTQDASGRIVPFDPAVHVAQRAVRAARRGDIAVAEHEFLHALRLNPNFDLTRAPEFWTLSPAGVIAAAQAYRRVGRLRDARTLLTVARLSFGDLPAIRTALAELSAATNSPQLVIGRFSQRFET